jgi:hypothetical protein
MQLVEVRGRRRNKQTVGTILIFSVRFFIKAFPLSFFSAAETTTPASKKESKIHNKKRRKFYHACILASRGPPAGGSPLKTSQIY